MNTLQTMIEMAKAARDKAYAPYSNFYVGVCLRTKDDKLYSGCNVENASYGLTLCAEAGAISSMVLGGDEVIVEAVVIGSGEDHCSPCGRCRQLIREFGAPNTLVHFCNKNGSYKSMTISELLPESFGPENLPSTEQ